MATLTRLAKLPSTLLVVSIATLGRPSQDNKSLPDWENVDWVVFKGTSGAGKSPVFKRLRWESGGNALPDIR
jgi:hypothetical protein